MVNYTCLAWQSDIADREPKGNNKIIPRFELAVKKDCCR